MEENHYSLYLSPFDGRTCKEFSEVIILNKGLNSRNITTHFSCVLLICLANSSFYKRMEITQKASKGNESFLHATHRLNLIYMYTKYYQTISKG